MAASFIMQNLGGILLPFSAHKYVSMLAN